MVRDFRKQIADKAFERTGTANIRAGQNENFPVNIFRAAYLFDFPGLQNGCPEKETSFVLHRSKEHREPQKLL